MARIGRGIGALVIAGVLLLAGCVSTGGYGGPTSGGYGPPRPAYPQDDRRQLQGTVDGIDRAAGRILLITNDARGDRGGRTQVRYDQWSRLFHQGREAAVEGLERGDVVRIEVEDTGRELRARTIEVLRDVRDRGHGSAYPGGQADEARGMVASVDARSQTIRLDGGRYGRELRLRYDQRTAVEFRGRLYRPEDLDRGDLVTVRTRRLGNGEWLAERIFVERSVRH